MKKKFILIMCGLLFLLSACGKPVEENDKKKNVEKMVEAQQSVMSASYEIHKTAIENVKAFDGQTVTYENLKNILTSSYEEQVVLAKTINSQSTTEYRGKINDYFAEVIKNRMSSYQELLKLVRIQDEVALKAMTESIEKKDTEVEKSSIGKINEQLKSKKVKEISSLKK